MKKIFLFFICIIVGISVSAQNINLLFKTLPNDVVWGLTDDNKAALLDSTDSIVTISNSLYTKLTRIKLTTNYISINTSPIANVQIKLLSLTNGSKIICVVKTVYGPAGDSQIQFYTTKWEIINNSDLFPKIKLDWFLKPSLNKNSSDFKLVSNMLDMNPFIIKLLPNNDNILVSYDIKKYLSKDDYKKVEPYLNLQSKKLIWDEVSYK